MCCVTMTDATSAVSSAASPKANWSSVIAMGDARARSNVDSDGNAV